MSASLTKKRAIALSYGTVLHPTPPTLFVPAHILSTRILKHLWENWGTDEGGLRSEEVDLYSVNIPLVEQLLHKDGLKIYWTTIWRNSYGQLFKSVDPSTQSAAMGLADQTCGEGHSEKVECGSPNLTFSWAPQMEGLVNPALEDIPKGTDGFAIYHGNVSVTPIRASFAEPSIHRGGQLLIQDKNVEVV
jgi:tubulin---tyrosine ligase